MEVPGRSRSKPVRLSLFVALLGGSLLLASGCTRRFFRERADKEVDAVLHEKDKFPRWAISQFHPTPDPLARFADPTNPDRPPKPPDDFAAQALSPNPQKPGKAGITRIEGVGYLDLLAQYDAENRARTGPTGVQQASLTTTDKGYGTSATPEADAAKEKTGELAGIPCLRTPADPFLINLEQAVELGLVNSREYQDQRENLYLAALPVTVERFAFAAQFFALGQVVREQTGRDTPEGQHNRWRGAGTVGFTKVFPTGALLLFRMANQFVVEMGNRNGGPRVTAPSTLSLDIIQPLLRGGGKAVTLEPLTQTERSLLYEIRTYARFREQFYANIAGGSDSNRSFLSISNVGSGGGGGTSSGLPGSVLAEVFRVSTGRGAIVNNGEGSRFSFGASSAAPSQGYLPTILLRAQLQNDRANVSALEGFLLLFKGFEEGGDVAKLQVDQVEQQLLQGRSTVLQRELDLMQAVDSFKLQLGIPTDLKIDLDDRPVKPITKQIREFDDTIVHFKDAKAAPVKHLDAEAAVSQLMAMLVNSPLAVSPAVLAASVALPASANSPGVLSTRLRARLKTIVEQGALSANTRFRQTFPERWAFWVGLKDEEVVTRLAQLARLLRDAQDTQADYQKAGQPSPPALLQQIEILSSDQSLGKFELALRLYEARAWLAGTDPVIRVRQYLRSFQSVVSSFDQILSEPLAERLITLSRQWPTLPNVLLDDVNLLEASLDEAQAAVAQAALANRFDLMNQRARVVDSWRQINVTANSLLGIFNVEYHLTSFSPQNEAKPLAFGGSGTRSQLVMNGELPLVRIQERNAYRAAQIALQRQRRALQAAEDEVLLTVRQEIRQLRQLAENYRIQQRAVELAYTQVDNSLEVFQAPPQPTAQGGGGNTAANAAALTQQLLNAQRSLPQAQNQLLAVWISYQIARLELYRDLELMPLDNRGVWIDDVANLSARPRTGSDDADQRPAGTGPVPERLPEPRPLPPAVGAQAP